MKKLSLIILIIALIAGGADAMAKSKQKRQASNKSKTTKVVNIPDLNGDWRSINDIRGSNYSFNYSPSTKTLSGYFDAAGGGYHEITGVVKGKTIILSDGNRLTIIGNRLKHKRTGVIYEK